MVSSSSPNTRQTKGREPGRKAKKPSRARRWAGRVGTFLITTAIVGLSVGTILQGTSLIAERAAATVAPNAAPLVEVAAIEVQRDTSFRIVRSFIGQIEAGQSTRIAFERPGLVTEILVDEGDLVEEGQPLGRLDQRLLNAEKSRLEANREAIEAQAELARLTTERSAELQERGFASTQTLDQARLGLAELNARLAEIDAALVQVDIQLDQSVIEAPFSGTVSERLAAQGTTVAAGNPIVTVLEQTRPVIRVGIDPTLAGDMRLGDAYDVEIAGTLFPAIVSAIRPDLDPLSRTRTILLTLQSEAPAILEAGTLRLWQTVEQPGMRVPLGALQEGVRGLWTVSTLRPTEDGTHHTVGSEAVEVIHANQDWAYVQGTLQSGSLIVTEGVHRLVPGQTVDWMDGNPTAEGAE